MSGGPRLLVVGSSNLDFITRVPRLPGLGETVADGVFSQAFGGKGANQAVAAARAGASVTFVTAMGTDALGDAMWAALSAEGLGLSHAVKVADVATGTALIMLDAAGRNYLAVSPGANGRLLPEHVDALGDVFDSVDGVVLQMEVSAATNAAVLDSASRAKGGSGLPVLLNYAPADAWGSERGLAVDARIDVLVVNETEAGLLAGLDGVSVEVGNVAEVGERLRGMGPSWVVVTLGAAGCVAVGKGGAVHRLAGRAVEAVDTTAAGDTFCGVLAARLAEGAGMAAALSWANAAGALATTVMGAQPSVPTREAVAAFLEG